MLGYIHIRSFQGLVDSKCLHLGHGMMAHGLRNLGDNIVMNMSLIRQILEFCDDLDLRIRPWDNVILGVYHDLNPSIEVSYRRRDVEESCGNGRLGDVDGDGGKDRGARDGNDAGRGKASNSA